MTSLDRSFEAGSVAPSSHPDLYRVEVASRFSPEILHGVNAPTAFQRMPWLGSWYEALAERPDVSALVITVRDGATGEVALVLPLVLRIVGRLRVIEFADLNLTDYNAPLLGPAAPRDGAAMRRLWRAVRRALPAADVLRLSKLEPRLSGRPNPLALMRGAVPCALAGNTLDTRQDLHSRQGTVLSREERKHIARTWRIFTKEPDAAFERITKIARGKDVLAALESLQAGRMNALGAPYVLNEPRHALFYRLLIERGIADGSVVLTALTAGDEIVAVHLGLRHEERCITIRVGMAGGRWASCSPGRLVIARTMAALQAEGVRVFDLGIGDYTYKRRLGCKPLPLLDVVQPLSWRGLAPAARALLVGHLRTRPGLNRRLRSWVCRFDAFKF